MKGDHNCGYLTSQSQELVNDKDRSLSSSQLAEIISSAPHKQLIIIDTNIALHQLGNANIT
jgi:hypothetical protein